MRKSETNTESAGLAQGISQIGWQVQVVLELVDEGEDGVPPALGDCSSSQGGLPPGSDHQRPQQSGRLRSDEALGQVESEALVIPSAWSPSGAWRTRPGRGTDDLGTNTWTYQYDTDGRLYQSTDPSGNTVTTGYDADSRKC